MHYLIFHQILVKSSVIIEVMYSTKPSKFKELNEETYKVTVDIL